MPLPDNFSETEHLQDTILRVQNKIVRAEFSDVGDDNWVRDIGTPRASLRVACTHQESDSTAMTQMRNDLFYLILRKAKDFHPNIYGIPSQDFQEIMKFLPQVQLYFEEKYQDVDLGFTQLRAQVSYRLIGETSSTITIAEATTIANKIKTLFNAGGVPFFFKKGRELYTYTDQSKGYAFQVYAFDKPNAQKVIEQVLDIKGHTPDWELLNLHESAEPANAYPTIPETKTILGKLTKQPRKRPAGTVHFIYAVMHLYGRSEPLVLYDPEKIYTDALVR
jgi:hypothetical protein